jgi:subtilase family serine protease
LIVLSLTGPPWGGASGSITVNDTTRNQASAAAPASATRFYLSVNGVIDAPDVLLGSREVPALAGATSSSGSTALTIPAGTPSGPYYLIAQADGDQVVAETQEANNTALVFMWVGPDLTVAAVTAPPTADAGAAISVSDTTRNQGGGSATASLTRIYLSTNSVVDAGDTLLGSRDVAPLAAGASSAGSTTVTIPASVATGSYYLLVQADAGGAVAEALETNNLAQAYVQIGPDLTMTIAAPSSAAAGSAITVSDTVRNQGGGAAPATTSRFYLSANGSVDGGDALLGVRATPAIAAGGQDSGSSPFTIPAGTAPGTYYILSLADADNAVPEILETNNLGWRVLQVTP